MIRRLLAGVGRLLLGAAYVLAMGAVVVFAIAAYLISLPLRKRDPRAAIAKATIDLLATVGVLVQLVGVLRSDLDSELADPPESRTDTRV